jgi:hypothetical protein
MWTIVSSNEAVNVAPAQGKQQRAGNILNAAFNMLFKNSDHFIFA